MDKISVIMSTYKEPINWIEQSVNSILNQTYSNIEFIIVVDNPEYQELVDLLQDYAKMDSRVRLILNEKNIGLVNSLNKALSQCNGVYVARMDADDISLPDRLAHQIKYMNDKAYDLVGCYYEVFIDNKTLRTAKVAKTHEVCKKILQFESCSAHPAWIVRKRVFDALGGYRDFDACEDYDFLIRTALAGYKIGNVPEILLRYRDNPNSISHEKSGKQYSITQLLSEKYRSESETSIEEYQLYLKGATHKIIREVYKKIAELDRQRALSENRFQKIILLIRLLCVSEFRKMKRIRRRINIWKKQD